MDTPHAFPLETYTPTISDPGSLDYGLVYIALLDLSTKRFARYLADVYEDNARRRVERHFGGSLVHDEVWRGNR